MEYSKNGVRFSNTKENIANAQKTMDERELKKLHTKWYVKNKYVGENYFSD
jgi:hypothetical protein